MDPDRHGGYGSGREALLAATVHVVARKGLRGLTFRAVAEHAAVNNTLVVHHFGTRDALIEAALDWSVQQSIGRSRLAELPATEDEFCRSIRALIEDNPDLQVFQYEMILEARRRPELAGAVQHLYGSYISALSDGLQRFGLGGQPGAAEAVFAALDGLVLQLIAGVDPSGVDSAIRYLWSSLDSRTAASSETR
ncbi:TetR family transcriptional regulator [Pseudarthrobacter sp. J75]|uniref:TetR/AcrR family transcriptional regulator n=1 Tax=unclassified Pseudarthrobacter TaxID=2647000 RepID=UPI002E822B18|nr:MULTISPECIES: TetR family transcriptional regulator [unclassified Pseudarthrobacter]MEE2524108.1 TetR family transcriptional regulator [Pseudarthrobacter sp. J47]MEE2530387.1 TetR family transcriptional regulator [Pseudarthrobacter sp. J75]MEE2568841.1 TetR family transcriptional regulator [Pseudarthrobacter sp. J64]